MARKSIRTMTSISDSASEGLAEIIAALQNRANGRNMRQINDYVIDPASTRQGGMAIVYKGQRPGAFAAKALKMIRPDKAADNEKLCGRFMTEVRTLRSLSHANIVKAEEAFQFNNPQTGETYTVLVMEWLDGLNLKEYIEQREPNGIRREDELKKIAIRILEALEYAHDNGVLHLDIKPNNIFRTREGYIKLVDFGIAKVVGEQGEKIQGAESLTQTSFETGESTFKGTQAYASPEQWLGGGIVDRRSDIYSFGKTLNFLMTGNDRMSDGRFPLFNEVVGKCTQTKLSLRFQSCREVIDYIDKGGARPQTKTCVNPACRKTIDATFPFCPHCRTEQQQPQSKVQTCKKCGKRIEGDWNCCTECGTPKEKEKRKQAAFKMCPKCGHSYLENTIKCSQCHINLIPAVYCANCKSVSPADSIYCTMCGKKIAEGWGCSSECGSEQKPKQDLYLCKKCKSTFDSTLTCCPHCGTIKGRTS